MRMYVRRAAVREPLLNGWEVTVTEVEAVGNDEDRCFSAAIQVARTTQGMLFSKSGPHWKWVELMILALTSQTRVTWSETFLRSGPCLS